MVHFHLDDAGLCVPHAVCPPAWHLHLKCQGRGIQPKPPVNGPHWPSFLPSCPLLGPSCQPEAVVGWIPVKGKLHFVFMSKFYLFGFDRWVTLDGKKAWEGAASGLVAGTGVREWLWACLLQPRYEQARGWLREVLPLPQLDRSQAQKGFNVSLLLNQAPPSLDSLVLWDRHFIAAFRPSSRKTVPPVLESQLASLPSVRLGTVEKIRWNSIFA